MKANHPKQFAFLSALSLIFFLFGCEKTGENPQLDTTAVEEESLALSMMEDADQLALAAFQQNGAGLRSQVSFAGDFCENAHITHNEKDKLLILDFGEGCTSPKGVQRKGKLKINYSGLSFQDGSTLEVTFMNYYVNGYRIDGKRKTFFRGFDQENQALLIETVILDGKVTWPDGTFKTMEGEFIKKFFLPIGREGKVEVTGGMMGNTRLGIPYMSFINDALVYFSSCTSTGNWVPSQGIVEIILDKDNSIQIDYGDGSCDKKVKVNIGVIVIEKVLD